MQLKNYIFWAILISSLPSSIFAQKAEELNRIAPNQQDGALFLKHATSILSIKKSTEGIYVLTQRQGCYLIAGSKRLPMLKPMAMPSDRRDLFWDLVANENEVFIWANNQKIIPLSLSNHERLNYCTPHFAKTFETTHIAVDSKGTVYIGTVSDGLFVFSKDKSGGYTNVPIHISRNHNQLPSNNIQCLFLENDGTVWVGTDAGLACIINEETYNLSEKNCSGQNSFEKIIGRCPKPVAFSESIVAITKWGNSLLLAGTNDLYKATISTDSIKSVYQYHLSSRLSIPLSNIKELMLDMDGNLWIAANHLLHYNITRDKLKVISDIHTFRGQGFLSIEEDLQENKIWIGTLNGGLYGLKYLTPNLRFGY